ncbi:hypothetical protein K439DRAFT_981148 [Ramaria rubella]|nr:hypothetical protein K439DRAFT_981148 [Ramaria rubella]
MDMAISMIRRRFSSPVTPDYKGQIPDRPWRCLLRSTLHCRPQTLLGPLFHCLARDTILDRHVALKVIKSAPRYTQTALDEIKLHDHFRYSMETTSAWSSKCCAILELIK